jgi:hypothetical protein
MDDPLNLEIPLEFSIIVDAITQTVSDGGLLTTGPGSFRYRERLAELGDQAVHLSNQLLTVLREMVDLNGEEDLP